MCLTGESPLLRQVWPEGGVCCTWGAFWTISFRALNILLFMNGILTIVVGVWLHLLFVKIANVLVHNITIFPVIIIVIGCIIMAVSCIAINYFDRPLFMFIYFSLLMMFFFLEMTTGVLIFFLHSSLSCDIEKGIRQHMLGFSLDESDTNVMDKIQSEFACCGNEEPYDWLNMTVQQVPPSCCVKKQCDTTNIEEIYRQGCFWVVFDMVKSTMSLASFMLFGATAIPLLGSFYACGLALNMIGPAYSPVPKSEEEAPCKRRVDVPSSHSREINAKNFKL